MSKPFYADYVNHMLRFYTRYDGTIKQSHSHEYDVDKLNYAAVDTVLSRVKDHEKELIISIFTTDDPVSHTLYAICPKLCISEREAWQVISKITRLIAKERRLI